MSWRRQIAGVIAVGVSAVFPLALLEISRLVPGSTETYVIKYMDFLGGLATTAIIFFLGNYFWAGKTKMERIRRHRRMMARFLRQMQGAVTQCETLLGLEYRESELVQSQKRFSMVAGLIHSLGQVKDGLLTHYSPEEVEEDERLTKAWVEIFWARVVPTVSELATRPVGPGEIVHLRNLLESLEQDVAQTLELLVPAKVRSRTAATSQVRRNP